MVVSIDHHVKLVFSEAGFMFCNCVFIDDDVKAIIDTGADVQSLMSIKPEQIDMVMYTHHHYDHTRGHRFFTGAQTYIHASDTQALSDWDDFMYYNSIDRWEELMPGVDYREAAAQLGLDSGVKPDINIHGELTDGQVLDFGHTKVEVLHTPGHSAGHCCFWLPDQEFLFTGDICLTQAGPWYGEIMASPDDMLNSIDRLIALKPPRVCSCHISDINTDPIEIMQEFKRRIIKRDERIYNFLKKKPADIHEIADQHLIYRLHPTAFVLFWEKLMVIKHLERLEKMGLVKPIGNGLYTAA
ncbi:MAG TPA: MBL fold metallo-hydrolase [Syntrophomonadaceae bacterium]|nr:MBL fold metallo-hydrolase [Syntrophomonadaceae bacterium]HPU49024.1 MBL fold metallo-hydrolase [Syntrophomonadaceae bacterium]